MLKIQLNTHTMQRPVVNFHANTVTFYFATGNQPCLFHVGHLKSIESVEKRGKYYLTVSTGFKDNSEESDLRVSPKMQELVAAAQSAMKEFQSAL
ncbi:MAG: hypothetical protein HXY38_03760 [Chloroflexi bacterium]|nr:hypothetical protein [Chloroflexota bacterium]